MANVDLTKTQPPFKRSRGRPLGSKNKTKSPIVTKNESENHLKRITIEIPSGNDVIATLVNFARNRQVNITILDAFGTVSDIPILRPHTHNSLIFPYRRVYQIFSLKGTYMYSHFPSSSTTASNLPYRNNFMICFSTAEGGLYGGFVAGKLIASSVVVVTVELFKNLEYHKKLKTRVIKKDVNPEWNEDLTLSVIDPNHSVLLARLQPNGNDCGYYVMKNMLDIVSANITKSWMEVFNDPTTLNEEELYDLRNSWATCFLDLYKP